ncbi:hypothetical protein I090019C5_29960 [Phocaeicola massiliensis]|nr:hypothetical protein KUBF_32730 [Bacteroides finegoldii]
MGHRVGFPLVQRGKTFHECEMKYKKYGKAYHEVFSRGDGSLIVSTVHEESAEDTETEPHDGTQIDNGGQDAEHNPEHPDTGHLFLHVKGNALEIYILTFFHALLE